MAKQTIMLDLELEEFQVLGQHRDGQRIEIRVEKAIPIGVCPVCCRPTAQVHDRRWDDVWDIPWHDHAVVLWVHRRRYLCQESECPASQSRQPFEYESIDVYARRTVRLNRQIYELARDMPATAVAAFLGRRHTPISDQTVERLYQAQGQAELAAQSPPVAQVIGIDEFSIRKRHHYATVINDLTHRRPLALLPSRDKEVVREQLGQLPHREAIRAVVIDMWDPYYSAVVEALPEAKVVIDKFHVVQVVITALDRVRKRWQRQKEEGQKKAIYQLRYLLRKGQENLTAEDRSRLAAALETEPTLRLAYELKEALRSWYSSADLATARQGLADWYRRVQESGLEEMQEAAATIRRWEESILNYFLWRFTNGFTEGQNNKIKTLNRRRYGGRNFQHLRTRVLLEAA